MGRGGHANHRVMAGTLGPSLASRQETQAGTRQQCRGLRERDKAPGGCACRGGSSIPHRYAKPGLQLRCGEAATLPLGQVLIPAI